MLLSNNWVLENLLKPKHSPRKSLKMRWLELQRLKLPHLINGLTLGIYSATGV